MSPIARLQALLVSRRRRLTLFGRSVVLVGCELLANAACWIVAGILFAGRKDTQQILSLALLAWVCVSFSFVSESRTTV
jgi:high-affinity nickel-transport protein